MINDYKSLFICFVLGILSLFSFLFILGNIQTKLSSSYGKKHQNKGIKINIEQTIENDVDMTNVVIKGTGEVTREELEEKLEKMLLKQGINREKTKLNVEMSIEI